MLSNTTYPQRHKINFCDHQKQNEIYFDLCGSKISSMTAACDLRFLPNGQSQAEFIWCELYTVYYWTNE